MSYTVMAVALAALLIVLILTGRHPMPFSHTERTVRDRRSGRDRRQRQQAVPIERRRGPRRVDEIARSFVNGLER
jgi:hypothetical protein